MNLGHAVLMMVAVAGLAPHGWARDLASDEKAVEIQRALDQGWNVVAATRAEALRLEDGWDERELKTIGGWAAEGWLRAREPRKVLDVLLFEPRPHGALFWRGQAHLQLGELETAEMVLRNYQNAGRNADRARLALALVYLAQGREANARGELSPLRESEDPEVARRARLMFNESELTVGREPVVQARLTREEDQRALDLRLVRARASLQQGELEETLRDTRAILKDTGGGRRLHHAAQLLEVEALLRDGEVEQAWRELFTFALNLTETEFWAQTFDLLDRVHRSREDVAVDEVPAEILDWITDPDLPERQVYAMGMVGGWFASAERLREAVGLLEGSLVLFPEHPIENRILRLAMDLHGRMGADSRVLELAELWRLRYGAGGAAMVDFIAGDILYSRGEFANATERFQTSADLTTSLVERRRGLYNAAAAAWKAGETALFGTLISQLQVVSAEEAQGETSATAGSRSGETAADLELDRALDLAAKDDRQALPLVESFLEAYPDHPRWVEAQMVLADLCLLDVPPRIKAALTALDAAEKVVAADADEVRQRLLYTRLWCAAAEQDWNAVVEIGERYLERWPTAAGAAEVEMKMADAYYRMEDFANALTRFELVAQREEAEELLEPALFFAGRSAMNLMSQEGVEKALQLWEEVVGLQGPLAFSARLQQVHALRRQGREGEAIEWVEELLATEGLEQTLRWQLICEKAELHLLLGAIHAEHLDEAIAWLDAFLSTEGLPYSWRGRGGYLKATALQQKEEEEAAMVACYDVVNAAGYEITDPEELQWFYRAGFLAVDLLERQEQWEGAARMAERLANTVGDRATEAKDRATRIRLEQFIWEEK